MSPLRRRQSCPECFRPGPPPSEILFPFAPSLPSELSDVQRGKASLEFFPPFSRTLRMLPSRPLFSPPEVTSWMDRHWPSASSTPHSPLWSFEYDKRLRRTGLVYFFPVFSCSSFPSRPDAKVEALDCVWAWVVVGLVFFVFLGGGVSVLFWGLFCVFWVFCGLGWFGVCVFFCF